MIYYYNQNIRKMKISQSIIIVSLLLFSIIIESHSQTVGNIVSTEQIKLSNMTNVKFGYGIETNYLPIIEYTRSYNPLRLDCIIQTRTREKCNISLDISENIVEAVVKAIVQLDEKIVIVLWKEITTGIYYRRSIERVTTLDLNNCKSANSLRFPMGKIGLNNYIYVVPYKNGFHVITSINSTDSRTSYDLEGNKIGDSEMFSLPEIPSNINPLPNSKSLFMISRNDLKFKLSLVNEKVEKLIESEAIDVVSYLDNSKYSICWDDIIQNETMLVYCAQFDLSGNENYHEQLCTIPYHDWLLQVRNSKYGGVVLFTFNEDQGVLYVSAIKPNGQVETLSYDSRSAIPENRKILDFNESNGTFTFVYESNGEIIMKKLSLPKCV